MLGPMVKVRSAETVRRLVSYLGAAPAQLAEVEDCIRRWGQGTVQITLAPGPQEPVAVAWLMGTHSAIDLRSTPHPHSEETSR
jgi:hypothetical protein